MTDVQGLLDNLSAQHRCLFGSEASYCGAPATRHLLLPGDHPTMSCPEHLSWWFEHEYRDVHPIMEMCGLPGTTWVHWDFDRNGYCEVEGLEQLAAVEHAEASR